MAEPTAYRPQRAPGLGPAVPQAFRSGSPGARIGEAYVAAHPEAGRDAAGRAFDAYDIERQVAGPGGLVMATVAASAGTDYTDLAVTMKRSDGGAWSVSKVVAA